MTLYYSASTGGFYDDAIHTTLPADALEISTDLHQHLMAEQAAGRCIAADDNDMPIAADPPPPSIEQQLTSLRSQRDRLLADSDRTQLLDYPISPEARAAWATYRQALRDLPELYAEDPASAVWPVAPEAAL
jgi:hypothetical protein